MDIAPTFAKIAGTSMPTDRAIDGASFLPVLNGKPIQRKTPIFSYFYREEPQASLRQGDWVMTAKVAGSESLAHSFFCSHMYFLKNGTLSDFELYNIKKDIGQENNLEVSQENRFNAMKKKIIELHAEVIGEGYTWPDADFVGTVWNDCP